MTTDLYNKLTHNGLFTLGMDGSAFQVRDRKSAITWETAALQGVKFVAWRACVGGYYTDLSFVPNMLGARAAGIIHRLAYLVIRPDYTAAAHIDLFFAQLDELARQEGAGHIPPLAVMDVEVKAASRLQQSLGQYFSPTSVNQRVQQVGARIRDRYAGRNPILYSNYDYIHSFMGSKADKEYLTEYDFWVANYRTKFENSCSAAKPSVPAPFLDESMTLQGGKFWQFTADENRLGAEFGAESMAIDLNRTLLSAQQLDEYFGIAALSPQPEPQVPVPVNPELQAALADMQAVVNQHTP